MVFKGDIPRNNFDKQTAGPENGRDQTDSDSRHNKGIFARSEKRGTSTGRRTLSFVQVYGEAMLIQAERCQCLDRLCLNVSKSDKATSQKTAAEVKPGIPGKGEL